MIAKRFAAWSALALTAFYVGSYNLTRADDSNASTTPKENRWVAIVDLSPNAREDGESASRKNADATRDLLRNRLESTGIDESHILVFEPNAENESFRPTVDNLETLVEFIRNPEAEDDLFGGAIRGDLDKACECQIYLTAPALTREIDGVERDFIAPLDVELDKIESADASELLELNLFEDALVKPNEFSDSKPIERSLFVCNLLTAVPRTRSADEQRGTIDVDPKRFAARSADESDENSASGLTHSRVKIIVKNEGSDLERVDSFWNVLCDGMEGNADIQGNRDGNVDVLELANYVKTCCESNNDARKVELGGSSVRTAIISNAPYILSRAAKKAELDPKLFRELANFFNDPENAAFRKNLNDTANRLDREQTKSNGAASATPVQGNTTKNVGTQKRR